MIEIKTYKTKDLVLEVSKSYDPIKLDLSRWDRFIDVLCGDRQYQKEAIENAIENGEHKVPAFFTSDREGFSLYVVCRDDNKWDNRAVPYFDEMATEKNPNAIYPVSEIRNK